MFLLKYCAEKSLDSASAQRDASRSPAPGDSKPNSRNSPSSSSSYPIETGQSFGWPDIDGSHVWDPLMASPEANPLRLPDELPSSDTTLSQHAEAYPQIQTDYDEAVAELHKPHSPVSLQPSAGLAAIRNYYYSSPKPFTQPVVFEMLLNTHGQCKLAIHRTSFGHWHSFYVGFVVISRNSANLTDY